MPNHRLVKRRGPGWQVALKFCVAQRRSAGEAEIGLSLRGA